MRICLVTQSWDSWVQNDFEILRSAGHQVRVIQFRGLRDIPTVLGGTIWADLTFSWFGKLHAFFTVLFSRLLGKTAVVVAGGDDVANEPDIGYGMFTYWWKKWCPLFVFRYGDFILSVSHTNYLETIKNAKADPAKTKLVYHGFNEQKWKPMNDVVKENLVLTVGKVNDETFLKKGLCLFVQTAKYLPDLSFVLVGPWENRAIERLKAIASPNITFTEALYGEDLRQMYSRAKVYIQASRHESFGCTVAEAMLCECVPVVARRAALPEVVGDCGIYVDELTPESVAAAIKEALQKPELGQAARQRAMRSFPLERRREALLSILAASGLDSGHRQYQVCVRCVMDTTDPAIRFDENGVCNHCKRYEERTSREMHYDEAGQEKLEKLVATIKERGKNKEYDCLIGVSGGADSTMVAYVVKKQLGLRPLAVHLDNGWDSELAVSNIQRTLDRLGIDLYTHVLDWEEFKDLQLSFLKSSVINAETPTDHAIMALLFHTASERGVPYILGGSNLVTEGIMPSSWMYDHRDWRQIKGIHNRFGKIRLKTYPHYTLAEMAYYILVKRIKYIPILNFVPYHKNQARELIQQELGWREYRFKHHESIYTRFYQSYILPAKFNVDKRKAHLSSLILSGQITREEALNELKKDIYPPDLIDQDKEYVGKKLGLTEEEFDGIMALPIKSFREYPNSQLLFNRLLPLINYTKRITTLAD